MSIRGSEPRGISRPANGSQGAKSFPCRASVLKMFGGGPPTARPASQMSGRSRKWISPVAAGGIRGAGSSRQCSGSMPLGAGGGFGIAHRPSISAIGEPAGRFPRPPCVPGRALHTAGCDRQPRTPRLLRAARLRARRRGARGRRPAGSSRSAWTRSRTARRSPPRDEYDEVFAAVGRHPNAATGFDDDAAERSARLAADPLVRAIGETGLDYYRDGAPRGDQLRAFEAQIAIARGAGCRS